MTSPTSLRNPLLIMALNALLVIGCRTTVLAAPQTPEDFEARHERARQLLAESFRGPDPVLLQARAKAARRLFVETGDPLGEGLSLLTIASVDIIQDDFEAGQAAFDQAVEIVTAAGDAVGIAIVRIAEAATWRSVGHFEKATDRLRQALEVFQKLGGEDARFSLESLRYFVPQQFPPRYLEQTESLLEMLEPALVQMFQSMILVEMAGIQREQGLNEEASTTLSHALALPATSLAGAQKILTEKAEIEFTLGHPVRALELYESALPLARKHGDLALQARILRGAADVHESEGRHAESAEYRERADVFAPVGTDVLGSADTCLPAMDLDLSGFLQRR